MSKDLAYVTVFVSIFGGRLAFAQPPMDVDQYLAVVLKAHPSVQRAAGFEKAAAAERRSARLLPDPALELGAGRGTATDPFGPRRSERDFVIRQTVPWPPRFTAGITAADRAAEALRAAGALNLWELEIEARRVFSRLALARAAVVVAKDGEATARSIRDLVARRAELGEARETDRIRTEIEWLRQERNFRASDRAAATAEAVVRALAIQPLPDPLTLTPEPPSPAVALDLAALQALLDQQNPRLRVAEADFARARAQVVVARRARLPDVELAFSNRHEIDKRVSALSLGFRVPVWNANRGEVARAEAAAALAEAESRQLRVGLRAEFLARVQELDTALAQAEILETRIIPAASRTLELARLSYEAGETSLLDLLDAQRTYSESRRESLEARSALNDAVTAVRQLVGPAFSPWRER